MNRPMITTVHARQRGLTIVEIMVAMVLSLILTAGVVQVFLGSKNTYRVNDAMSRLQEEGRIALELMSRDVRMAGFSGCSRYGPVTNTLDGVDATTGEHPNIAYDFSVGIRGYDDVPATLPAALSGLDPAPNPGTDVVIVRRQSDNPVRIVKNNSSAQLFAEVISTEVGACEDGTDRISGICQGDILMVSDCRKSRVFQAGNIQNTGTGTDLALNITHPASGDPGNAISSWGGASAPESEQFGDDSEIVKVASYAYYVANNPDGITSLYRQDGTADAIELAQGVENLQVLYGVDTSPADVNQSADDYVTANNVTNWDNVISVRLHLLMRTLDDNMAEARQTYRYVDADVDAGDRRIRKEFTALVTLRNRVR
jgi:type IV pilus assembly protein PilW